MVRYCLNVLLNVTPRRGRTGIIGLVILPMLLSGCGSPSNPSTLLSNAKSTLDKAATVHFHLDNGGVAINAPGAYIVTGDGDAKRPDEFVGKIEASVAGLLVPVDVLSYGGTFYVQLPFSSTWDKTDPGNYGFNDPAQIIDPQHGMSTILVNPEHVQLLARDRLNGEELEEVKGSVAGSKISVFVQTADPSKSVDVQFGIAVNTHELRRVKLSNLYLPGDPTPTSYTIVLTNYGEGLTVTPPPSP